MEDKEWFVAYTRPRCEKKVVSCCKREGIFAMLPTLKSVKKYRGKSVVFQKPVFPSYVFLQPATDQRRFIWQNDYVVNLLTVHNQFQFKQQLGDVLRALDSDREVLLAPEIKEGTLVRIKTGALRGMEGYVDKRMGQTWLQIRVDFISQAVALKMEATEVEAV